MKGGNTYETILLLLYRIDPYRKGRTATFHIISHLMCQLNYLSIAKLSSGHLHY